MNREERALLWVGTFLALGYFVLQAFAFFGITSEAFSPHVLLFKNIALVALGCFVVFLVGYFVIRNQKRVENIVKSKYVWKLQRKIEKELWNEAKCKSLTVTSNRLDLVPYLATELMRNISSRSTPITYSAIIGDTIGQTNTHLTKINYDTGKSYSFNIPLNEGNVLAEKMSEISHNKTLRRHWLLFIVIP